MQVIIGLGNPGAAYAGTRHNLGFRVCDRLADSWQARFGREKFGARIAEAQTPAGKVLLAEPQTFMNLSGQSVAAAVGFYRLDLERLLVVCDDFNLPLGQLRMRREGSHGGHNGLRDVIAALGGETFPRLRLGTGPLGQADPVSFCLERFAAAEQEAAEEMVGRAARAAEVWVASGIEEAMNRFNTNKAVQE